MCSVAQWCRVGTTCQLSTFRADSGCGRPLLKSSRPQQFDRALQSIRYVTNPRSSSGKDRDRIEGYREQRLLSTAGSWQNKLRARLRLSSLFASIASERGRLVTSVFEVGRRIVW